MTDIACVEKTEGPKPHRYYTDHNENVETVREELLDGLVKVRSELAEWAVTAEGTEEYLGTEELYNALITKTIGATADVIETYCQLMAIHPGDVGATPFIEDIATDFFAKVNS